MINLSGYLRIGKLKELGNYGEKLWQEKQCLHLIFIHG